MSKEMSEIVPSISSMSAGWETKQLSDICEIERGGSPRPIDSFLTDDPSGINWIKIGDTKGITKYICQTQEKIRPEGVKRSRLVVEGDFILSNSMSFGRPYIMKTTGCIHDGWLLLRPKEPRINQDFLYYVLGSDLIFRQFDLLAAGSTVRNLNIGLVKTVRIPVPPKSEQERIVAILDEAFEGIETAKANTHRSIDCAREACNVHSNKLLVARSGWKVSTIGKSCILRSGTTLPPKLEKPIGEIPYLKVADMNLLENVDGVVGSSRYVDRAAVSASNILPQGTTIFPKRGGAILTNKKRLTSRPICADLNIMGVSPTSELDRRFLFHYFLKLDLRQFNSGSSIPQINNYNIEPLIIAFPISIAEQRQISAMIDGVTEETESLIDVFRRRLATLDELWKSLLSNAFSGNL